MVEFSNPLLRAIRQLAERPRPQAEFEAAQKELRAQAGPDGVVRDITGATETAQKLVGGGFGIPEAPSRPTRVDARVIQARRRAASELRRRSQGRAAPRSPSLLNLLSSPNQGASGSLLGI